MKTALCLLFLFVSSFATAAGVDDDWSSAFGCRVYHADRTKHYNETHNDCLSLQQGEYFVMAFKNSIWHRSYGVGYTHLTPVSENFAVGYSTTILSGYNSTGVPVVFPFATASYSLRGLGAWGRHLAVDFSSNYVVSQVQLRYKYADHAGVPSASSHDSPLGLEYGYGTDGAKISLLYKPELTTEMLEGLYVSGAYSIGSMEHRRLTWTDMPNTQSAEQRAVILTLSWFPVNNRWLGAYVGVSSSKIHYASTYALNPGLYKQAQANHVDHYNVGQLGGISVPLDTKAGEEVTWSSRPQPVIGFRVGNPFGGDSPVKVYLDISARKLPTAKRGVVVDSPEASASERLILTDILSQKLLNNDSVASWEKKRWLPSIQIGVNYRF